MDIREKKIRIPKDLADRIDRLAGEEHRSANAQIIVLLEEAMKARKK